MFPKEYILHLLLILKSLFDLPPYLTKQLCLYRFLYWLNNRHQLNQRHENVHIDNYLYKM